MDDDDLSVKISKRSESHTKIKLAHTHTPQSAESHRLMCLREEKKTAAALDQQTSSSSDSVQTWTEWLTHKTDQPIRRQQPDMVRTSCWSSNWAPGWRRKVIWGTLNVSTIHTDSPELDHRRLINLSWSDESIFLLHLQVVSGCRVNHMRTWIHPASDQCWGRFS